MSSQQDRIILTADSLVFYSKRDEYAFVDWLKSIPGYIEMKLEGQILLIEFTIPPKLESVQELVAIFYRYGIDMKQLSQLENEENSRWMRLTGYYWVDRIFSK